MIIIAITSIIGTIIPLFYSWWYVTLLILLSLNLIICTIDKFPATWGYIVSPKINVSNNFILNLKIYKEIEIEITVEFIKDIFKKNRFKIYKTDTGFYAETGRFTRLGSTITHISIIIILIGSTISLLTGFKGHTKIFEGETKNDFYNRKTKKIEKLDFDIKLNKFNINYYPRKVSIKVKDLKKNIVNKYEAFEGKDFVLSRDEYKIKVEKFIEDFDLRNFVTQERFAGTKNAAVELSLFKNDNLIKKGNFFWGYPEFQEFQDEDFLVRLYTYWPLQIKEYNSELTIIEDGKDILTKSIEVNDPLEYKDITFYQTNFSTPEQTNSVYMSGFEVVKDPGVETVYFGCFFMIIGVILSFYSYHQRIWINFYSKDNNKLKLLIGGISNKNYFVFEQRFRKILSEIESQKNE